jgi:putative restriction endonuclease
MKQGQRLWTREELILAINLYCKLPFGKMHGNNPDVIGLAKLINRTTGSIALKLGNFASFDPSLQARGIKGASNASKLDGEIWKEFFNNWNALAFESELLLAKYQGVSIEQLHDIQLPDDAVGKNKERIVQTRVNQAFFRKAVMASYNYTCCITGIRFPELLVASHIRPWALDEANRLNPRNGLAINALHDRAFENGLMTIGTDYRIRISESIKKNKEISSYEYFMRYDNEMIRLPNRFIPDPAFLAYHHAERFIP